MKTITKERILKALSNAERYYDSKPEPHVVMTMAQIGLKSLCADALGGEVAISDREKLELAYHHFNDPEEVFKRIGHLNPMELDAASALKEAWLGSWQRLLEKLWERKRKIYLIQYEYRISGLEKKTVDFGCGAIEMSEPSDELEILPSDYDILRWEREKVVEAFLMGAKHQEATLYQQTEEGWSRIDATTIRDRAGFYGWAKLWSCDREVHLLIGRGRFDDEETDSVWFCARLGSDKPAL